MEIAKRSTGRIVEALLQRDARALGDLLAAGSDPNQRDTDGRTPLHHAAIECLSWSITPLVRAKADVRSIDINGWTPLHFSAQNHDSESARLLIEAGAVVDALDSHGNTPLWRAVFASKGRGHVLALLMRAGADKTITNDRGVLPEQLARNIANYDISQWLA